MIGIFTYIVHLDLAAKILFGFVLGALLGLLHFGALWWNVQALTGGASAKAVMLHVLRFAVLLVVLYGLAKLGAPVLLAASVGVLVGRGLVLRHVRIIR
ncbi:ATP synthase subunit I [Rhizobium jaguaris]|uniref:N-ATPase subunit AtpR n=1 Tax=Rhizobium jaguaris TaxID=1312183 RepID=UPI0039BF0B6A